jgi:TetR/AcrR family transcriptional regulator, transcriptional repressor for nem operon
MPRSKAYSEEVVLDTAMQVFWNHGYETTSVRLLEKEMGINQFSIYSSFLNKKNLFIQSLRRYRAYQKQNEYQDLLKDGAGWKEFESYLLNITNGSSDNRGCLVVNTAAEINATEEVIMVEINAYYDFIRGMIKKILSNAIQKGEIPANTDIEKQSAFFLGVMQGVSVASKTMKREQLKDFISLAINQIK